MADQFDPVALGFLTPLTPSPAYDDDVTDIIGDTVAGITGLDRNAVRPRWVPDPASQPPRPVNWCTVGVTGITSDDNANTIHDGWGNERDGTDIVYRGEEITVLASFYGPLGSSYASLLRDGFAVQRNRAAMKAMGLVFGKPGTMRNASGLVNTENLVRYDFDFVLRRRPSRTFAVPNIRSVSGEILSEQGSLQGPRLGVNPFQVG